jgi:hypothetical protein
MPSKDFEEESLLGHPHETPGLAQAETSPISPKGKTEHILRWLRRPTVLHISAILLYTLVSISILSVVRKDCLAENNVIFGQYIEVPTLEEEQTNRPQLRILGNMRQKFFNMNIQSMSVSRL